MFHFWDSVGEYATADLGLVWDVAKSTTVVPAIGRFGGPGLRTQGNSDYYLKKYITGAPATVGITLAFRPGGSIAGLTCGLATFFDDTGGEHQLEVRLSGGFIQVLRGNPGGNTLIATGTKPILLNTYYSLEIKVLIHPSAGTVVTKINGVVDINGSGLNTRKTATSQVTSMYIGTMINYGSPALTIDTCDIILWDTTGGAPQNDYPGDCRVQSCRVNADGGVLQWTRNAGANDHSRVEEAAEDADTTYLSDSTVGDRSTFGLTDLSPTTGTILGVAVVAVVRKDDAGVRSIVTVQRAGGVNYDNATVHPLGTTYTYERDNVFLNPATSAAYTVGEVNALEAGVKLSA